MLFQEKTSHCSSRRGQLKSLLNIIIRRYSDYSLESEDDYYYISKMTTTRGGVNQYGGDYFILEDNRFSADLKKVRFRDVLADLMDKGGYEYSLLGQNDSIIERFSFNDRSCEEIVVAFNGAGEFQLPEI